MMEDKRKKQVLAMAYVPTQDWNNLYDPCKALKRGTLFAPLDKPFLAYPMAKNYR